MQSIDFFGQAIYDFPLHPNHFFVLVKCFLQSFQFFSGDEVQTFMQSLQIAAAGNALRAAHQYQHSI